MSLKECVVHGRRGWQWGNGKCHTGRGGQARAEAEGATEVSEPVSDVALSKSLKGMIDTVEKAQGDVTKAKVPEPKTTAPATVKVKAKKKRSKSK